MSIRCKKLRVSVFFVWCMFFLLVEPVLSCAPSSPVYIHTPDDLKNIYNLNIDFKSDFLDADSPNQIVFENLKPEYLFAFYRKMVGRPLSDSAKQRLFFRNMDDLGDDYVAAEKWQNERKQFMKDELEINKYGNCFGYAFLQAVDTLKARQSVYAREQIVEWIKNQDTVFAECKYDSKGMFRENPPQNNATPAIAPEDVGFWKKIIKIISRFWPFIRREAPAEVKNAIETSQPAKQETFVVEYDGLLQQDFEYQQAAGAYYRGDWTLAEKLFSLISEQPNHPWKAEAAFSLGRLYIDAYQSIVDSHGKSEKSDNMLAKAEEQLKVIISNPEYRRFHQPAHDLLDYIFGQRDKFGLYKKVDDTMLNSDDPDKLARALTDYLYFLPDYRFNCGVYNIFEKECGQLKDKLFENGSDMTQWVLMWEDFQPEYLALIKDRYNKTQSEPWLLSMARFLPIDDHDFKNVEAKVGLLPRSSVAYWTANFYLIQKAIDSGQIKKAKQMINKIAKYGLSVAIDDYLEDFKMQTTSSLVELFKHSERHTYVIADTHGYTTKAEDKIVARIPFLDNKAKMIFEGQIPLKKQVDLVLRNDIFASKQATFLRLVTMVRSFLLKDYESARSIALVLAKNNQQLNQDLSRFISASTNEEKEFYAVDFMLQYPGIGISIYDEAVVDKLTASSLSNIFLDSRNDFTEIYDYRFQRWDYCQPTMYVPSKEDTQFDDYGSYVPIYTWQNNYNLDFAQSIITKDDQETAKQELDKIFKEAPANYFAEVVLAYADKHPNSTVIPMALHQIVLATRFAVCSNSETTVFSKKAFQMLHYDYPKSYWTTKTPYYY